MMTNIRLKLFLGLVSFIFPSLISWYLLQSANQQISASQNVIKWPESLAPDNNQLNESYQQLQKLGIWTKSVEKTETTAEKQVPPKAKLPLEPEWSLVAVTNTTSEKFALIKIRGNDQLLRVSVGSYIIKDIKLIALQKYQITIHDDIKGVDQLIALYE